MRKDSVRAHKTRLHSAPRGKAAPGAKAEAEAVDGKVTFESRKTDDLKPFPLQPEFWGQESQADDDRLEQSLRRGQRERIPIMPYPNRARLPKNTMLDGHRRWSLWKKLGIKRIEVIVRHDLANADITTVEAEFLTYNSYRQLHIIDKARVAKRRFEIEKGRSRGGLRPGEDAEARERVGKIIGIGGRELQRYWRLLKAPVVVQDAVRNKLISLTLGEKVGALREKQKTEIAEKLRVILPAKTQVPSDKRLLKAKLKVVVQAYIAPNGNRRDAWHGLADFCASLKRGVRNLDGRLDEIPRHNYRGMKADLLAGRRLIDAMIPLADEAGSDLD
jgi:hypothetical protein